MYNVCMLYIYIYTYIHIFTNICIYTYIHYIIYNISALRGQTRRIPLRPAPERGPRGVRRLYAISYYSLL